MKPKRIQLKRTKGWRMPPGAVKIDRSTKWGNPFKVGCFGIHPVSGAAIKIETKTQAVDLFDLFIRTQKGAQIAAEAPHELKGKNLACWCKAGDVCHGDVLLWLANGLDSAGRRLWA